MAKHTSALCNACRIASSKTANPVAKRHFVQSAKEVANSTANLVKTIKVLMLLNCASFFLCVFICFLSFFPVEAESGQLELPFYLCHMYGLRIISSFCRPQLDNKFSGITVL